VMRLETSARIDGAVASARYALQLIGRDGAPVAEVPLMRLPSQGCGGGRGGCGCGCDGDGHADDEKGAFLAQALLPDREPGQALRIVARDDAPEPREVWVRKAPDAPVQIGGFDVDLDGDAGRAKWEAEGRGETSADFTLLFSKDGGRSWNSLASGVTGREVSFDASAIPAGELIFRLLAHDGFFTAKADTRPMKMRERAPGVAILHPRPGSVIEAGVPMRLWASVDLRNGQPIDPAACRWTLDGQQAGSGPDVFVTAPEPGRHVCTITVETRAGASEAKVEFETFADGQDLR
jgi:hypothetical protein